MLCQLTGSAGSCFAQQTSNLKVQLLPSPCVLDVQVNLTSWKSEKKTVAEMVRKCSNSRHQMLTPVNGLLWPKRSATTESLQEIWSTALAIDNRPWCQLNKMCDDCSCNRMDSRNTASMSLCFLQGVSLMCFRTFFCENMDDIALRLIGIHRNRNNAKPMTVWSREEYLRGQNRKGTWTQQISQHRLQIYPIDSTRWVHPRTSWETRSRPIRRGWH